jgi:hypothetical protein
VRREDGNEENAGMLVNLFQLRSINFNKEISRSHAIRNFDIQCDNFSKIEDTRCWPYIAEPCNVEDGLLYNINFFSLPHFGA